MKKTVRLLTIIILTLLVLGEVTFSQTWRKVTSSTFPAFSDIHFFDESTGIVIGSLGAIYKTYDGGLTWQQKVSNTNIALNVLHFIDNNTGYIGAAGRKYLKTVDGGESWSIDSIMAIPQENGSVDGIYFSDPNTGWVLASTSSNTGPGWVLRTVDGGANWELNLTVSNNRLLAMDFYQPNIGIVVGRNVGALYYTTDGVNWNLSPTPSLGGFIYTRSDIWAVKMVSPTIAYAGGWGSSAAGLQPTIHLKTTNGGQSWEYLTQIEENRTYENLYGYYFKDENTGIAVGAATRGTLVTRTSDGGQTWITVPSPFGTTARAVSGIGDKLWIAGGAGLIATSNDFGSTWELLTPIPSSTLHGFTFTSLMTGYAAGFDGVFIKTTDGGGSFKGSYITAGGKCYNVQDIHFLDDNIGFAAHSYRMVTKTTNGGQSWFQILPDTIPATFTNSGIFFIDELHGVVVGRIATSTDAIYRTTDGGISWTTKLNTVFKNMQDVAFANETIGAIVADGLKGVYTTNGGETWEPSQFNNVPGEPNLRRLVYISPNDAVAVGDKIILRSRDGGANWDYIQTGADVLLNSVTFKNDTLYAVGNGEIWRSVDLGDNWLNIIDPEIITGTLNSVTVDARGDVWIGGVTSNIFTTMGDPPVSVENNEMIINSFRLNQNYPNPFNPSTIISYQLPVSGYVSLKLYNVLGKEVASLINNEWKEAGSHNYSLLIENSSLPSGVYFYRLQSGSYVQTKKMLLLK